jgi:carbon monoxide dehydrogenase subunit G
MQLEHSFTVPVGVDDAWKVLLDIERVAPCMPGAAVDTIDGDDFTGTVKVKLGPIGLTYKGKASFVEKDEAAHRAVIHAQGRDARGNGTAAATVTATLTEQSGETKVDVLTDLDITGKPAQFGRGVMVDVGNKLIGQFADCLAGKLAGGEEEVSAEAPTVAMPVAGVPEAAPAVEAPVEGPAPAPAPAEAPTPVVAQVPRREVPTADVEPINLLESAGPAVAKRLVPIAIALVLLLIILRLRKR